MKIYTTSAPATPGTVTDRGLAMRYAHATPGGYVADGCRCHDCILAGTHTGTERARADLAALSDGQVRLEWVAAELDLCIGTVRGLLRGERKRVRRLTEHQIATLAHRHRTGQLPTVAYGRKNAGATLVKPLALVKDPRPADPDLAAAVEQRAAEFVRRLDLLRGMASGWRARSACIGKPSEMFFAVSDGNIYRRADQHLYRPALAVCATCPVAGQCHDEHQHERDGVYGGTTPLMRRDARVRAARSAVAS